MPLAIFSPWEAFVQNGWNLYWREQRPNACTTCRLDHCKTKSSISNQRIVSYSRSQRRFAKIHGMQGIVIYVTGFSQLSWFSTSFGVANHYWWIRQKDLNHNRFIALIGNSFFVVVVDYFPSNQWVLSIMKGVHFHWFGNTRPTQRTKGERVLESFIHLGFEDVNSYFPEDKDVYVP